MSGLNSNWCPVCYNGDVNCICSQPKPPQGAREWTLDAGDSINDGPEIAFGEEVRVIEYSAFRQLSAKLEVAGRELLYLQASQPNRMIVRLREERDEWKAKHEISERIRRDDQLRTYDGLTTKLDRYEAALEQIAKYDPCADYIAKEALGKTGHWKKQEEKKEDTLSGAKEPLKSEIVPERGFKVAQNPSDSEYARDDELPKKP